MPWFRVIESLVYHTSSICCSCTYSYTCCALPFKLFSAIGSLSLPKNLAGIFQIALLVFKTKQIMQSIADLWSRSAFNSSFVRNKAFLYSTLSSLGRKDGARPFWISFTAPAASRSFSGYWFWNSRCRFLQARRS